MAAQGSTGKGGGQGKHGRDSRRPTHQRYNGNNIRDKHKRVNILRSNGQAALTAWDSGNRSKFPRVKRNPPAPHDRKKKE
jgi:hypothetical protein